MSGFEKLCLVSFSALNICSCNSNAQKINIENPWDLVTQVENSIGKITFPDKTFNINDFGAKADGKTNNSEAFKKAIEECSKSGGGIVLVPPGKYVTGPIHLKDSINLHLNEGAEILFSTNPNDYYPLVHTSFEGTELMNYSPLIYAFGCKTVGVTGNGILNGQANQSNWWPWKGSENYGWQKGQPNQNDEQNRVRLVQMAEEGVPVEQRIFGNGHYLRPGFVEPFKCENVLIEGVTIINAPFWILHPIKCKNVLIDGVTINSHGPNNDGCDPEYSKNVIIRNATFNTGDDCIAIKSGRDADGRRVAIKSENIIVQNCKMIDGHGGVVMGSEISAGVSNVFVENCTMDSPNLDRAIRIKSNSRRGGLVENIYVRNIEVGVVKEAVIRLNMFYATYENQTGNFIPTVRNIQLENVKVKNGGKYGILAKAYKELPIKNLTLKNVIIEKVDKAFSIENVENVKLIDTYINGKLVEKVQ